MSTEEHAIRIIRAAGTAALVLFLAFQVVNPKKPVVANTRGFRDPVAAFELASRPEDVLGILGRPGDAGRPRAVRGMELGLYLDFFFLVAYPAFYLGIALLLRARGGLPRGLPGLLVALAVAMAAGDALENREMLRLCGIVDPGAMEPALARLQVFTRIKWYAVFAASALIVPALWRQGGAWRWSAPFFGLGAVLGFASIGHPPAIEWTIAPLGLAWTIVWIGALRRRTTRKGTPLAATARSPRV
jgi:hypothetical protein